MHMSVLIEFFDKMFTDQGVCNPKAKINSSEIYSCDEVKNVNTSTDTVELPVLQEGLIDASVGTGIQEISTNQGQEVEHLNLYKAIEELRKQMEPTKEYDQRISSQNISCTITKYEKPGGGRFSAENILQYELRLREAQRTVSNRDILIKMLHDQLKRFEDLYKKTIDENREVRLRYCNTVQELSSLKKQVEESSKVFKGKSSTDSDETDLKSIESLIEKQTKLLQKLTQDMANDTSKNSFNEEEETQKEKLISTYEYSVSKTDYESNRTSTTQDEKIKSLNILEELQSSKIIANSIGNNVALLTKNFKEIGDKIGNLETEVGELKSKFKTHEDLAERITKLEKVNEEKYEQKWQELSKKMEEMTRVNQKLWEENHGLKKHSPVMKYDCGDSYHDKQPCYSFSNLSIKRSKSDQYVGHHHLHPNKHPHHSSYYVLNLDHPQHVPTHTKFKKETEYMCAPKIAAKGKCAQDIRDVRSPKNGGNLKFSKLQNQKMAAGENTKTDRVIDGVPLKIYLNNLQDQLKIFSNIETAIDVLRKDLVLKMKQ